MFVTQAATPNPSIEGTLSGLRPPSAPHVKRWAFLNTVGAMRNSSPSSTVAVCKGVYREGLRVLSGVRGSRSIPSCPGHLASSTFAVRHGLQSQRLHFAKAWAASGFGTLPSREPNPAFERTA